MRHDDIHITGLGVALGAQRRLHDPAGGGAGGGRVGVGDPVVQRGVSVSTLSGPDLAVQAGRIAVAQARLHGVEQGRHPQRPFVDVHLHTTLGPRGVDGYSAARYVREHLTAPGPGLVLEVGALSGSVLGGVDLVAGILRGRPDLTLAALTAGDTFHHPGISAWNTELDMPYGDAGSAVVLARTPGLAEVVATQSWTEPRSATAPPGARPVLAGGFAGDRRAGCARTGDGERRGVIAGGVCQRVLEDACVPAEQVAAVLTPFHGTEIPAERALRALGVTARCGTRHLAADLGHLGASDHLVALDHLLRHGDVTRGDWVLLVGGSGVSTTAVLLRIT